MWDSSTVARLTVEQSIKSSSQHGSNNFHPLNGDVPNFKVAIVCALVAAIHMFLFVLSSLFHVNIARKCDIFHK